MQLVRVTREKYQVVALTCLVISAKYEEKEENVPAHNTLLQYIERQQGPGPAQLCDSRTIHNMEMLLLTQLHWSVTIVTPLHYLGLFERKVSNRCEPER